MKLLEKNIPTTYELKVHQVPPTDRRWDWVLDTLYTQDPGKKHTPSYMTYAMLKTPRGQIYQHVAACNPHDCINKQRGRVLSIGKVMKAAGLRKKS